jgi:hypothetical protein
MSSIAETEHARSGQLDNPESIYRPCADMKLNQEVLRVILLDTRYRQRQRTASGVHGGRQQLNSLRQGRKSGWETHGDGRRTGRMRSTGG